MNKSDNKIDYASENQRLFEMYRKGNCNSRNKIVELNLNLVKTIAKSYSYNCSMDYDDLFQEGIIALIDAIDDYDSSKEHTFSTYATECIKGKIKNYIDENKYNSYLSRGTVVKINKYRRLKNEGLNDDEIAKRMRFNIDQLNEFVKKYSNISGSLSLDSNPNNDSDESLMNICGDEESINNKLDDIFRKELLEQLKKLLTYKQYQAIYLMFGFGNLGSLTNEETAKIMGTSRQNINKIKNQTIMKLCLHDSIKQFYEAM